MIDIPMILAGAVLLYIVYMLFFTTKGSVVYIEWYKLINTQVVRHQPNKIIKAKNVRKNGIEKLILPKSVSKLPMEGYHPRDLHITTGGHPVVKILEIAPDQFTTLREFNALSDKEKNEINKTGNFHEQIAKKYKDVKTQQDFLATYELYVIEKDVASWAEQEEREIKNRHNTEGWQKYLPYAVVMLAIIVGAGVFYWAVNKSFDHVEAAQKQSWDEVQEKNKQADWIVNTLQNLAQNGISGGSEDTNADKPPAASGGGTE